MPSTTLPRCALVRSLSTSSRKRGSTPGHSGICTVFRFCIHASAPRGCGDCATVPGNRPPLACGNSALTKDLPSQEMVEMLVRHGLDVNIEDAAGETVAFRIIAEQVNIGMSW